MARGGVHWAGLLRQQVAGVMEMGGGSIFEILEVLVVLDPSSVQGARASSGGGRKAWHPCCWCYRAWDS